MKDEFLGFYEPTSKEINDSWKEGTFIFDANALLNLYRYSDSTRKDFLLVIGRLKDKLFMPYQVGFEYHNNRINVIESLANSYSLLYTIINDLFEKQVANQLGQFKRHPSINLESFLIIQKEFLQKISDELDKQKKTHPDFMSRDDILNQLTELYTKKVGKPFTKDELQKIYTEGKDRYDQLIPPGYKDLEAKKKKGDQHLYGDLIIWKEIINHAKKEKKPIIFITDDRKEDWWKIENGKTIRPREELIKEFYDLTGIRILIYTADSFLHFSKERKLVTEIKETSIDEIKEVRKSDEEFGVFRAKALQDIFGQQNANSLADVLSSRQYKTYSELLPSYRSSLGDIASIRTIQEALKPYTTLSDIVTDRSLQDALKLSDMAGIGGLNDALNPYTTLSDIARGKGLQDILNPYTTLSDITRAKSLQGALNPYTTLADLASANRLQDALNPNKTLSNITSATKANLVEPDAKAAIVKGEPSKNNVSESIINPTAKTSKDTVDKDTSRKSRKK